MSYRVRKLPDGEWGPGVPTPKVQSGLPMSDRQWAATIKYYLQDFVDKAPRGLLGRGERKRRVRIVLLELELLRYEAGTDFWDKTRQKIIDIA